MRPMYEVLGLLVVSLILVLVVAAASESLMADISAHLTSVLEPEAK